MDPLIGSEALASSLVTPYALRSRFTAIYPDVYLPRDAEVTAAVRARAAWLWSRREGVVAGQSAAALHRAKWVDSGRAAEVLSDNRRPPIGIRTWSDRFADDEIEMVNGIRVTTPARSALDIACHYPLGKAVAAIDALARATHVKMVDVELLAARYTGGAASGKPALPSISSIPAPSHLAKPGCGCCLFARASRVLRHRFPSTTSTAC
jgi:hypothetical protein